MINLISENLYIIFLLPLWNFLIIMIGRFFAVYVNKYILYFLTLLFSFVGIISTGFLLIPYLGNKVYETQLPFIKINDFIILGGIYIDKISLIFALTLFLVSFFIQIFSIFYTKKDKKSYRFFALLNLFNFSLSGMFFSPNLFQMFIFWEITAITSYLLVGYNYNDNKNAIASRKVFLTNKIGDTSFISGIILCSYLMYEYAPSKELATLSFIDMDTISTFIYAYTSTPLFLIICGLFLFAIFVKSALFPFYTWLQDAMEAELPVSALLHSATLLAAGLFLLIRLIGFFALNTILLKFIFIISLVTIILCSLFALFEDKPKKILAYSTSAQYGLLFLAISQLNIKIAILLYIAHAFIKSTLFLTLPNKKNEWNKINSILFFFSGLSLCGLLFAGFETKELFASMPNVKIYVTLLSFITALYMTRLFYLIKNTSYITKSNLINFMPAICLFGLNILYSIYLRLHAKNFVIEPFLSAILGILIMILISYQKYECRIPMVCSIFKNALYIDKLNVNIIAKYYYKFSKLCSDIDTKFLSNHKIPISYAKSMVKISDFVEDKIFNNFVKFVVKNSNNISIFHLKKQTGNVQNYNFYAFIIITMTIASLIIIYTFMLGLL